MQTLEGAVINDVEHNLCKTKQFWGLQVGTCKGKVERALMRAQKGKAQEIISGLCPNKPNMNCRG